MCGEGDAYVARILGLLNIAVCVIKYICITLLWSFMEYEFGSAFYTFFGIGCFVDLVIVILLLIGLQKEKVVLCTIWWCYSCIILVSWFGLVVLTMYIGRAVTTIACFGMEVIGIMIYCFLLDFVQAYMKAFERDMDLEQSVVFHPV